MTMKTSRRLVAEKVYHLCGLIRDQTVYLKSFKPSFYFKLDEVAI